MSDDTEAHLLDEARAGDAAALDALIRLHQGRIYRFGRKMCRDPEDAREVLQDTLLTLARGIRDFRGDASLATWLYTVARSFCIKKRRRRAPGPEVSLDAEPSAATALASPAKPPDDALAGREVERALEQAIASLSPMYREVLVLRDVEGLSAAEVAEVVGAGVDAVKSRLHRARLTVREQIAPLLASPAEAAPAGAGGAAPVGPGGSGRPGPGGAASAGSVGSAPVGLGGSAPVGLGGAAPVGPGGSGRPRPGGSGRPRPGGAAPPKSACPDVLTLFSRRSEGEISAADCAEMERHLEGCERCRGACDSLRRTLSLCRTAPSAEVPPAVQASVRAALQTFLIRS